MKITIPGISKPIRLGKTMTLLDKVFGNSKSFTVEYVNDQFCRGSNVPVKMIPMLKKLGIERVDNFRVLGIKKLAELTRIYAENGIEFVNLPIDPIRAKESVAAAKEIVIKQIADGKKTLGQCTYGKHRTGIFMALVENIANGVPMPKAIENMHKHGWGWLHKFAFHSGEKQLLSIAEKI